MTITFPLALPNDKIASMVGRAVNSVVCPSSPFSFSSTTHHFGGQRWEFDIQIPPLSVSDAEDWIAFLISLQGSYGTFLLGDPSYSSPRGSAGGTPLVSGGSQSGAVLAIDGATSSQTGWLKAGDYIQLGSGSTATLHRVLQDADSDGSGNVSLDIWPDLRSSPADNAAVTLTDPKGVFSLAANITEWNVSEAVNYGISFVAREVV